MLKEEAMGNTSKMLPRLLINPKQLTCHLNIGDWPACQGIQKMIGFSKGFHHRNSIRLGYNRSQGEDFVRLWMYAYVNCERIEKMIGEFKIGQEISVHIYWLKSLIAIEIYKPSSNFPTHDVCHHRLNLTLPIGYLLRPYAEIDGPEDVQTKFDVDIRNLKIS